MRRERFQRTATGEVPLGTVRFMKPGQRVYVAAAGATADTLSGTFEGSEVIQGLINIEVSSDVVEVPRDLVGAFFPKQAGELILSLAGTVTGTQIDVWILSPGEERPW